MSALLRESPVHSLEPPCHPSQLGDIIDTFVWALSVNAPPPMTDEQEMLNQRLLKRRGPVQTQPAITTEMLVRGHGAGAF